MLAIQTPAIVRVVLVVSVCVGGGEIKKISSTEPVIYLPLYISFLFKVAFLKILPLKGPVSHKDGLS